MSTVLVAIVVVALSASAPLPAQQWSAEQQEVWQFELGCQESREARLACFHEDYLAWSDEEFTVPVDYSDAVAFANRFHDTSDIVWVHMKPMEISVHGNVAVVLMVGTWTIRNKTTGEETTRTERWTDVCMKENGRWAWIADHGGPVGGS